MAKTKDTGSAGQAQVIYCGPNLGNGALLQFAVFRQGLPVYLDKLLAGCPAIRSLIVPVEELSKVRAEIKQPGTYVYQLYQSVQEFNQRGVF